MALKIRIPSPYNNNELKQLICLPFEQEYEDVLVHRVERMIHNDIGKAYINIVRIFANKKSGIEGESDQIKLVDEA